MSTQECTSSFSALEQRSLKQLNIPFTFQLSASFDAGAGIQHIMLNYDINLFLTQQPSHKMFPSETIRIYRGLCSGVRQLLAGVDRLAAVVPCAAQWDGSV